MLSAKIHEVWHSLSFRLTLWHAGLLLLALGLCYAVSYFLVASLMLARVDAYLKTEADECVRLFNIEKIQAVQVEAAHETEQQGAKDLLVRMTDPSAKVLFETDPQPWSKLQIDPEIIHTVARTGQAQLMTMNRGGSEPQVRVIVSTLSPTLVLVIADSISSDLQFVQQSMRLVLLVMVAVWVLAVTVGFFLARRAIGRIAMARDAAIDFAGGKTSRRVTPTARGDEADLLANAYNAMADRIEALLVNLRQTNDSLAHELRSPVTGIRGRCELALTGGAMPPEGQAILADTVERCDHMLGIINTILELSETDAGVARLAKKQVDLAALLNNAVEIFGPVAEDAAVKLSCNPGTPALVVGDPAKLQRLFSNLLDNAIKYSGRGGSVTISVETRRPYVIVSIQDTGPGIAGPELEKIFERFYRGSASEGRPGNGLGLSLARTIARAHGGEIRVNSELGRGSMFTVHMPVAS